MTEDAPRHLHPATMLIGSLRNVSSLPVLVPIVELAAKIGWWAAAGLVGFWLLGAASALLKWYKFTYRIDQDALVIDQGVLHRSRRVIPLERIQDVSIEQKPLQRLLRLVTVRIETGGGSADEGLLDSVNLAEAQRLRETLRGGAVRVVEAETVAAPPEEPLFAMPLPRVLLFGAFSFSLLWMAALGAATQYLDDVFDFEWQDIGHWLDLAGHEASARFGVTLVLAALGALLVLGFLSGLAGALIRDFGFRLVRGEGRFRRVRGLLTRTEAVIAIRRIQLALIERRPVRSALGWASLQFQTLGGSNDIGGRQQMAPFARAEEIDTILDAAGLPHFEREGLARVARGHGVRSAIRAGVPLVLAAAGLGLFLSPFGWLVLLLLPPVIGVALLQRRYHRYALRAGDLQVMHGVIRQRDWIVPRESILVTNILQGPLQRMLGTASVLVDTAGAQGRARPDIEDLPLDRAVALARELAGAS